MRYLFIDDDKDLLRSLKMAFDENPNVVFAECHSVEDGLQAIAQNSPNVIFLDHQLTEGGSEGFEIADKTTGTKIYTTTSNSWARVEYEERGIEAIRKTDLKRYRQIIGS